jgi:hypothetical protein
MQELPLGFQSGAKEAHHLAVRAQLVRGMRVCKAERKPIQLS